MWMIPKKTKVNLEIFKNVTIVDILIGFFAIGTIVFLIASNIPGKFIIAGILLVVTIGLMYRIDNEPNYQYLLHILLHMTMPSHYRSALGTHKEKAERIEDMMAVTDIRDNVLVYNKQYYGAVLEIPAVEYRFFSENRKNNTIHSLGKVLRNANPSLCANIVKIDRPVHYDTMRMAEEEKLQRVREAFERAELSEVELQSRVEIIYDRINEIDQFNGDHKVVAPFYYIVLFDQDENQLEIQIRNAIDTLAGGEMKPKRLDNKELAVFLRYTNELDFDEKEIDEIDPSEYAHWAMPRNLDFTANSIRLDGMVTYTMRIINYPVVARDAWLATVLSMPGTKCVLKCKMMDREKSIRNIDRSLSELRGQYSSTGHDSKRIELQSHIETLEQLLITLQNDNESLMETNIYITAYDILQSERILGEQAVKSTFHPRIENMKRVVKRNYSEQNLRLGILDFQQQKAFVASQVSAYDPFAKTGRGIPSSTLGASYPWVFASICDEKGIHLGNSEGVPVFMDFFKRDSERVNSNVVIVGKSGSGKSYSVKSILANLAADDAKIFVLDPENEYTELAGNLHGQFINVGNASSGRLNPFHIMTALEDEQMGSSLSGSYETHLQFLEEFFRQILPDCDKDAMEYLNAIVDRMYLNKGITVDTDLSTLRPQDYPLFDDLYDEILQEFQQTDNEYIRSLLRILMNYISKFSTGGRNAGIWNGYSTVTTEENFSVFNFQSLLANRNGSIANAQMLLVLKYIDNEIIKNREYNRMNHANRKVIVVIDEAHVFIDAKYPIALDFMAQLAKRIRKYNGMQIVITQNIKDFVGTEEIAAKSGAVINACQYSMIFSLAPNDMDDLCKLYEKAGGINDSEREQIMSAPRGQAFAVLGPSSRTTFRVEVPRDVVEMFEEPEYQTKYFAGEEGYQNWLDFVGDSLEIYEETIEKKRSEKVEEHFEEHHAKVVLETVDELPELGVTIELGTQEDSDVNDGETSGSKNSTASDAGSGADSDTALGTNFGMNSHFDFGTNSGTNFSFNTGSNSNSSSNSGSNYGSNSGLNSGSNTEELLAQLLLRLGNDSLSRQIREAVAEEMQRQSHQAASGYMTEKPAAVGVNNPTSDEDDFWSFGEDSDSDNDNDVANTNVADDQNSSLDEDDFWDRLRKEFTESDNEPQGFDVASYVEEQRQKDADYENLRKLLEGTEKVVSLSLQELTSLAKK